LTSFWWQTVPLVANRVKNKFRKSTVALYGNYPVLETSHARFCPNVDILIHDFLDVSRCAADFSLYDTRLPFCSLDIRSDDVMVEIDAAVKRGTHHFAFFNQNIFENFPQRLEPVLKEIKAAELPLQMHGICGVETSSFPIGCAEMLHSAHFQELHLEPMYRVDGAVDEAVYREVMTDCERAGLASRRGLGWESEHSSAFLWIGRPDDDVEKLVWNALKLVQLVGMVIPKPFSPTPGTPEHDKLLSTSQCLEPEDISPHRLPFAEQNGVTRGDYMDLYRLTALLNAKVRSHTFDFLGDTFLARTVRQSLSGRRWAL
jgi:hypothetical protein